jgi:hypothetical protein
MPKFSYFLILAIGRLIHKTSLIFTLLRLKTQSNYHNYNCNNVAIIIILFTFAKSVKKKL